jgi:hypothetical protein
MTPKKSGTKIGITFSIIVTRIQVSVGKMEGHFLCTEVKKCLNNG